jgi:hypothetical protein
MHASISSTSCFSIHLFYYCFIDLTIFALKAEAEQGTVSEGSHAELPISVISVILSHGQRGQSNISV